MTASENAMETFSILIVDDEPKNIQLLGNLLRANGHDPEFALSGEKALSWLEKKAFDLVLLDVMMPEMDGFEVCRRIKADMRIAHIPVIFLTAKTEMDDIVKGFEVGGSDYVTKPFNPPELLARIKVHVEIKTLRGLIPICAHCKNIRDDEGIWHKIETYVQNHSLARFSHSLCPHCMETLYGDQAWFKKRKNRP